MIARRAQLAVVALLLALVACGPGAKERALTTTLSGVNAARSAFLAWDGVTQDRIVAEATSLASGQHQLEQHRARRATLITAFEAAYYSLAIAATDLDDINLAAAVEAAAKVFAVYRALVGTDPPSKEPAP